ncbi:acylphosphatase [Collinsella tanakaei]|nr:acylphosphatase [Collinsella tanakaei]
MTPQTCVDEILSAGSTEDIIRVHVLFCGPVQGVGFRWNMQSFAEEAGVAGWVKNLPDGATVEAELEGTRIAVAKLIARMDAHYEQFDAWFPSRFEVGSWREVSLQHDTSFTVRR